RLNPCDERMRRVTHLDAIGRDRWMRDELAAEHLHEALRFARCIPAAALEIAQYRVRTVQREPAPTFGEEPIERRTLCLARQHVARVSDQEVRARDSVRGRVVLMHARTNALLLAQQLEQLQAGEIHVVVFTAADEHCIDRAPSHGFYSCTRLVNPLSA